MDLKLAKTFDSLTELLQVDLKDAQPISVDQAKKFRNFFSIEAEELGLYYNAYNLVITSEPVLEELKSFIDAQKVISSATSREHNLFIVVYPYFNDPLIRQALED